VHMHTQNHTHKNTHTSHRHRVLCREWLWDGVKRGAGRRGGQGLSWSRMRLPKMGDDWVL
jgi:hypothetical protein